MKADRRRLDNRRVGAFLVDELVFLPLFLIAQQYDWGAVALVIGLQLVYFHLSESTSGQTIGKAAFKLRVVTVDGDIVSPQASSARTLLRLIDTTLIGLIVYVATGERRQRLGDMAAKTIVVDANEVAPAEVQLGRWHLVYPIGWLAPALVVAVLSAGGKLPMDYRAQADALCAEAELAAKQIRDPDQMIALQVELMRELDALDPPKNWKDRHDVLMAEGTSLLSELDQLFQRVAASGTPETTFRRGIRKLRRSTRNANARIRANGYGACGADAKPA